MKKILRYPLIAFPFVAFFGTLGYVAGMRDALILLGGSLLVVLWAVAVNWAWDR